MQSSSVLKPLSGRCVVPNCNNSRMKNKITFHRIPKDPKKADAWIQAIKNPHLINMDKDYLNKCFFVCTLHFAPEAYVLCSTKSILKPDAVPTKHLPTDVDLQSHIKETKDSDIENLTEKNNPEENITESSTSVSDILDEAADLENSTSVVEETTLTLPFENF